MSQSPRTRLAAALAAVAFAAMALAGCATPSAAPAAAVQTSAPTPTAEPAAEATPTPTPTARELPDWAKEMHWLIYPEGFKCAGTEGCPNDYVKSFGQPGPVLPDNVEYYDPKKHDCGFVQPEGVDCWGMGTE